MNRKTDRLYTFCVALLIGLMATSVLAAHSMISPFINRQQINLSPNMVVVSYQEHVDREFQVTVETATDWVMRNQHSEANLSRKMAQKIVKTVYYAAAEEGLDPLMMLALIKIESAFWIKAESTAGALGLTQIIPYWHADKGVNKKNAMDPVYSIRMGTQILVEYLGWHKGDLRKALLQYNGSLKIKNATYANRVFDTQRSIAKFMAEERDFTIASLKSQEARFEI